MNLYEINNEIMDCIDTETGEIIKPEKLENMQMAKEQKVRNIACYIKNLQADAKAYEEEEKTFYARKKAAQNKADNLKKYLAGFLNGTKIKGAEFAISWRKSSAVEVTDSDKIPAEFHIHQPDKIDKAGLKNALKSGEVAGAKLVEHNNMIVK